MKESYPTSNTWPYVLSVMAVLAFVLSPPSEWPDTVTNLRSKCVSWFATDIAEPPADVQVAERVVVAFDPLSVPDSDSSEEVLSPSDHLRQLTEIEVDRGAHARGTIPSKSLTGNSISAGASIAAIPSQIDAPATKATPTDEIESRFVWQPPPGWQPALIQPLANSKQANTESWSSGQPSSRARTAEDLAAATESTDDKQIHLQLNPIRSEIAPPVANLIARVERRIHSQPDFGPRTNVTPVEIDLPESSYPQELIDLSEADAGMEPEFEQQPARSSDDDRTKPSSISQVKPEHSQSNKSKSASTSGASVGATVADKWPASAVLGALLQEATRDIVLTNWAAAIRTELNRLESRRVTGAPDQVKTLNKLRELATAEVDRRRWPQHHRSLHDRLRFALLRRLDVWQPLMKVAYVEPSSFATYRAQKQLLEDAKQLESKLTNEFKEPNAWVDYLALPTLSKLRSDKLGYRELAENVLARVYSNDLTVEQRQYLQGSTFKPFTNSLRNVIAKSVHPANVMTALEAYESAPSRSTSNDLILLMQRWRSAPNGSPYRPAIDVIVSHYRNANLRLSVSEDLINRFVPAMRQYAERVDDNILGATVTGQSSTHSNLAVQLIPDDTGIRLGMLAAGRVDSSTASRKGPVTAFSRGQSAFAAGKEVVIRPQGITSSPTETRAKSGNEVVGIRTDWDDVPFIGQIVRSMAKEEIDEQRRQVEAEMQLRVRRKAQQRMDRELDSRVAKAGQNLDQNIVAPLRRLELDPQAMEMRTTHDRAILRTRLASAWQFAAHTPRPQIRADSKMSFQIHQSAANNIIEQLQLQGKRMTLEELMVILSQRFGIPMQVANDENKDVVVKFAEHPLEFDFTNGQIKVTLHFAELQRGKRRWKNFSIRGYYRADVQQLDIELARDGTVELIGDRIGLRDQLALRAIAVKVFSKNQSLNLLRNVIQQQPQLRNLTITQFTIRDGWLAVALGEPQGPSRFAEKSSSWRGR